MSGQRPAISPRWIHVGWPIAIVGFTAVYLTLPGLVGDSFFLVANLLPIGAILIGLRIYPLSHRVPWYLSVTALALMSIPDFAWLIQVDILGQESAHPLTYLGLAAGHLVMLGASISIVLRHAPADPGGVLHAALIGLGLSGPLWELVLRPMLLANGTPPLRQGILLTMVLALMTIMGTLLRIMKTTVKARASVYYLFLAMAGGLAAVVLTTAAASPDRTTTLLWAEATWFISYFSCVAVPLHPAVAYLSLPAGEHPDDLSARRLASTAVILSMTPVTAGITVFFGGQPDVLLLIVSTLVSIPLVLVRFWHLGWQRLKAEQALTHQASHDELTRLPNRRRLLEEIDNALRRVREGALDSVTVLFCDLDGFKPINDSLGHEAGDHVLREVSQRLRHCVRVTDMVGRFGGDEFLIVCFGMAERSVDDLIDRISTALAEPINVQARACAVGASIGVAVATSAEQSADALIARADQAMYADKHARKGLRHAA